MLWLVLIETFFWMTASFLGMGTVLFTLHLWRSWRNPVEIHIADPLERVRTEVTGMARMKRAVGYCISSDCEDYAKGVFLLNHGDTFYCPRCRALGRVERETGSQIGKTDIFKEVRVEYNFDPVHGIYREIAIVRDESLWGKHSVYLLRSPLIKTDRRALKVAESCLANLNRYRGLLEGDEIPRTHEHILHIDQSREEFFKALQHFARELEGSALTEQGLRSAEGR